MNTDSQFRRDVIDELEWEPSIDAAQIGVAASAGVITLTGAAPRDAEKMEAERTRGSSSPRRKELPGLRQE